MLNGMLNKGRPCRRKTAMRGKKREEDLGGQEGQGDQEEQEGMTLTRMLPGMRRTMDNHKVGNSSNSSNSNNKLRMDSSTHNNPRIYLLPRERQRNTREPNIKTLQR